MTDNGLALLFIVDRSGSMSSIRSNVVEGMNDIVADLKRQPGFVAVDYVQFNESIEHTHKGVPLSQFKFDLQPGGQTALYDGIVTGVSNLRERIAKKKNKPSKVQVVVVTDGHENASRVADAQLVKDTVEYMTAQFGWDFTFLGANQDAVFVGAALGFEGKKSMTFASTAAGVEGTANSLSEYINATRRGEDASYSDANRSAAMGGRH